MLEWSMDTVLTIEILCLWSRKLLIKQRNAKHSLHCMMAMVNVDCERSVHQRVVWSRRVLIKLPCVTAPLYRGTNNYSSNILLTKSKQQSKHNLDAYIPL